MLQEHVKTTKTDKTRFFFARKRWTWYATNNYYLMSHSNQPNVEGRNCVWTTKYERLSEMCIAQHVEMKSVFTFQPIKRLVFSTVNSAKPAATFWVFLFCDQKPTIVLFGGNGTHCHAKKTSRDYGKEKPSAILKNFLRQSQPSTSELEPKKVKMSPNME